MSNLTRLEAVSDALDTAISTANSLPDAGGGGGGENATIETCTVKVTRSGSSLYCISYNKFSDGAIVAQNEEVDVRNSYTVENVVLGTWLLLHDDGKQGLNLDISNRSITTAGGITMFRSNKGSDSVMGESLFWILFRIENEGDSSRSITIS